MVYENFNPRNLKNRNPKISDRIVKEFECRILDQEMERAKALMEEDRKN